MIGTLGSAALQRTNLEVGIPGWGLERQPPEKPVRQDPMCWCRAGRRGVGLERGGFLSRIILWGPAGEKRRDTGGYTEISRNTLSEAKSLGLR